MKFIVPFLACLSLTLVACATTGTTASTNDTTFAYDAANFLQQFNKGAQALLPTADAVIAYVTTNDSTIQNDQNLANIAASLINAVATAQKTSTSVPVSVATVNAVLAPATVETVASTVTTTP
jgi:hypothetical protein